MRDHFFFFLLLLWAQRIIILLLLSPYHQSMTPRCTSGPTDRHRACSYSTSAFMTKKQKKISATMANPLKADGRMVTDENKRTQGKPRRRRVETGIEVTMPADKPLPETAILADNTFYFQQRRGRLDLKRISRINVERVIEDVDIDTLQSVLESIAFADLNVDDLAHYADDHFVKLFRLSQLIIEYLLNVQNALLTYAKDAEDEYSKIEAACKEGERRLRSRKEKMSGLKKELKRNRKTISTYERLLKQKSLERPARVGTTTQTSLILAGNNMLLWTM